MKLKLQVVETGPCLMLSMAIRRYWKTVGHEPVISLGSCQQTVSNIHIYIYTPRKTNSWNLKLTQLKRKKSSFQQTSMTFGFQPALNFPGKIPFAFPQGVLNPLNSCHGEINSDTTVILASTLLGSTPDCNSPVENAVQVCRFF